LPLAPEDLKTIGIAVWGLDYFPGRSSSGIDREAARRLREEGLRTLLACRPRPEGGAWAAIPGGSFEMGWPAHRVTVSPFWMGIYAVTNREYRRLVPDHQGDDALPAAKVSWYAAYAYAAWLGGRLPTEAEWEYAARAGSPHAYSTRDGSSTALEEVGWYDRNSGRRLHPVGELKPNPWGLYDMYGNVWEWVANWYGPYTGAEQVDPWGPPAPGGRGRVVRGGGYGDGADVVRAAYRDTGEPWSKLGDLGLRVVLPRRPRTLRW